MSDTNIQKAADPNADEMASNREGPGFFPSAAAEIADLMAFTTRTFEYVDHYRKGDHETASENFTDFLIPKLEHIIRCHHAKPAASSEIEILTMEYEVEGVREFRLTAIHSGQCVGCVGVRCRGLSVATVRQLYVTPEYRKQGLGLRLMRQCNDLAEQHGCLSLNLSVAHSNRQVIPFYFKQGFILAHQFDDLEAIFVKPLPKHSGYQKS